MAMGSGRVGSRIEGRHARLQRFSAATARARQRRLEGGDAARAAEASAPGPGRGRQAKRARHGSRSAVAAPAAPAAAVAAGESSPFIQGLLAQVHSNLATRAGEPLNAVVLKLLGSQALAACCRATAAWATVRGKRVCAHLVDGPAHLPLHRLDLDLVESVRLNHGAREGLKERADVILHCRRAVRLYATYCGLTGISQHLQLGPGLLPWLNLRQVRFRQCGFTAVDVVQLMRCSQHLDTAVFLHEPLAGLGDVIFEVSAGAPPTFGAKLAYVEFMECQLAAQDVTCVLRAFPALRSAHFQSMDLHGLRMPALPTLQKLGCIDCNLSRADVFRLMASCKFLESLALCGNSLETTEEAGSEDEACFLDWPHMPRLKEADFRLCELTAEDEAALGACLPVARVQVRQRIGSSAPAVPGPGGAGPTGNLAVPRHVVFEDSSSSEAE